MEEDRGLRVVASSHGIVNATRCIDLSIIVRITRFQVLAVGSLRIVLYDRRSLMSTSSLTRRPGRVSSTGNTFSQTQAVAAANVAGQCFRCAARLFGGSYSWWHRQARIYGLFTTENHSFD